MHSLQLYSFEQRLRDADLKGSAGMSLLCKTTIPLTARRESVVE